MRSHVWCSYTPLHQGRSADGHRGKPLLNSSALIWNCVSTADQKHLQCSPDLRPRQHCQTQNSITAKVIKHLQNKKRWGYNWPDFLAGQHLSCASTADPNGEENHQQRGGEHHLPCICGRVSDWQGKSHGATKTWWTVGKENTKNWFTQAINLICFSNLICRTDYHCESYEIRFIWKSELNTQLIYISIYLNISIDDVRKSVRLCSCPHHRQMHYFIIYIFMHMLYSKFVKL